MTETLKERAERVRKFGVELLEKHSLADLREVWCRLPDISGDAPAGQRALAERVALHVSDMGDAAPTDLKAYIETTAAVREFKLAPPGSKKGETETGPSIPTTESTPPATTEDTATVSTTAKKKTTKAKAKATSKPAAKAKASPAAKKAVAKKPARVVKPPTPSASKGRKKDGPRAGTMTELVIRLTKEGKDNKAIGKAVMELAPKSQFADEIKNGDYHAIAYYQGQGRKRGWLPKK